MQVRSHRFEHRDLVRIGRIGEELTPEWQRTNNPRRSAEEIPLQNFESSEAIFARGFFTGLLFQLLKLGIKLLVLLDRHIVLNITLKHAAMPESVSKRLDLGKAPHFRLHHFISDRTVFAFRLGPSPYNGRLGMRVAGEMRSHRLGHFRR